MSPIERGSRLHDLFGGLVEQVFMVDLGVCDPQVVEYLTSILMDFLHVDQIYRMRTINGESIREIAEVEAQAYLGPELAGSRRTFLVNRFIGDFTLFWAGVFPENLRPRRQAHRLQEYLLRGKRSYGIASEFQFSNERPAPQVLRALSEQFEFCVHGLQCVRQGFEKLPPPRLTN